MRGLSHRACRENSRDTCEQGTAEAGYHHADPGSVLPAEQGMMAERRIHPFCLLTLGCSARLF